jgi:hypothetical protein
MLVLQVQLEQQQQLLIRSVCTAPSFLTLTDAPRLSAAPFLL